MSESEKKIVPVTLSHLISDTKQNALVGKGVKEEKNIFIRCCLLAIEIRHD
jgi:fatty acid-binding protein DegV